MEIKDLLVSQQTSDKHTNIKPHDIEIYANNDITDEWGNPLLTLKIGDRYGMFVKQFSSVFARPSSSSGIMQTVRESYQEGEGYQNFSRDFLKELTTYEIHMSGKSHIKELFDFKTTGSANLIYEEAATFFLARSKSQEGRNLAKALVGIFFSLRRGEFVEFEGSERLKLKSYDSKVTTELRNEIYERGYKNIAYFNVRGDMGFYNDLTTQEVKERKGIMSGALTDYDSEIELTAKTLAKKLTKKQTKSVMASALTQAPDKSKAKKKSTKK